MIYKMVSPWKSDKIRFIHRDDNGAIDKEVAINAANIYYVSGGISKKSLGLWNVDMDKAEDCEKIKGRISKFFSAILSAGFLADGVELDVTKNTVPVLRVNITL